MRQLEQKIVWKHGTPFIVRRVPPARSSRIWYSSWGKNAEMTTVLLESGSRYVIFAPCGKYLARVTAGQLKRWLNHFGLNFLLASCKTPV